MERPSETLRGWYHELANGIAKKYSPAFARQADKISGLEQEVKDLTNSNTDLTKQAVGSQLEIAKIQNKTIIQARKEYRESVRKENSEYIILIDDRRIVRFQGEKTIEILGNITTKDISKIFYTEGEETPERILDTILDTDGGYLHIKNNGKNFPVDISVTQLSIKDSRFKRPFIHTTRIDVSPHYGWTPAFIQNILDKKKNPYQISVITHAAEKENQQQEQ